MNDRLHAPMFRYLMVLTIASVAGLQSWRTPFNNFAVDVAGLQGHHVGRIQSIREIPGFMARMVVWVLLWIREHRLSALSTVTMGAGVVPRRCPADPHRTVPGAGYALNRENEQAPGNTSRRLVQGMLRIVPRDERAGYILSLYLSAMAL